MPESLSTEQAVPQISQAVLVKFWTVCCFTWPLRAQVIDAGLVIKVVVFGQRGLQTELLRQ